MFAATELGVMAYNRETGEWEPKPLTQIPDQPLSIQPHADDMSYGKAIARAFAENRYQQEMNK